MRVLAAVSIVGYAGLRGAALLANATALQVGHIIVSGNERLATGDVLALLDGLRGRNILGVNLVEWQDRLLSSPWVEEATLRRVFPGTVEVRVRERTPMAIGRIGSALYLVDSHGRWWTSTGRPTRTSTCRLSMAWRPRGNTQSLDESRAALAARVIGELNAHPSSGTKVSQIDVTDAHDAVVMLEGDTDAAASRRERLRRAPAAVPRPGRRAPRARGRD